VLGRAVRETGQALDRLGCVFQGSNAYKEQLSRHRRIVPLYNMQPRIAKETFIAPNATIIGKAEIGKNSAVWYGAVIRSDVNEIKIGDNVSIGDRTTIHVTRETTKNSGFRTSIGNNVTVGAASIIHGATLEDGSTVECGSCVLDGAVVGARSIVAPGSLVLGGTHIPSDQYWAGSPAKFVRNLSEEEKVKAQEFNNSILLLAEKHEYWHCITPAERAKLDEEAFLKKAPEWKPESLF